MPTLGLTGTVGCGKSLALEILAGLGAETIQADRIGHDLLRLAEVRQELISLFGEGIIGPDGEVVRARVGELVFGDEDLRRRFNAVIHPRLLAQLRLWLDSLRNGNRTAVVEAALIPEWGIEDWFDEVWCIRCSDSSALERWKRDPETFWKIRSAQFAPERKAAKATKVIDNERSQEEYRRRIEAEYTRFEKHLSDGGG